MEDIDIVTAANTVSSVLTIITCSWLFIKYLTARKRNVGFTLIIILAFADTCYGLTSLFSDLFPDIAIGSVDLFQTFFFYSMHFSIIWSCAISYLVYRSLKDKNFESNTLILKALGIILLLSAGLVSL